MAVQVVSLPNHLFVREVIEEFDKKIPIFSADHLRPLSALKRWSPENLQAIFGPTVQVWVINDKGVNIKTKRVSTSTVELARKSDGIHEFRIFLT